MYIPSRVFDVEAMANTAFGRGRNGEYLFKPFVDAGATHSVSELDMARLRKGVSVFCVFAVLGLALFVVSLVILKTTSILSEIWVFGGVLVGFAFWTLAYTAWVAQARKSLARAKR